MSISDYRQINIENIEFFTFKIYNTLKVYIVYYAFVGTRGLLEETQNIH